MQVQKTDSDGKYRLLYCSSKGNKCGVMQELDKGVEPNVENYDKRTALHLAACEGCTEIVILLLEKGADVNSIDRWGRTPLSDARGMGHTEICKILEAYGGNDPVIHFLKHVPLSFREKVRIFLKELALWQKLRHPNIVQFLGILDSDRLIFLTEYLKNVGLHDILRKKGRLDPLTAVCYALDIARNVLQDEAGHLKVTGFHLSKTAREKDVNGYKMTGGIGSYRYMAPEVYRRESYDKSVDVYSFAFVVHEVRYTQFLTKRCIV
ncbi:putative dual-specificity kinase TKL-Pl-4 family [Helianthus debilis subsp. tardiflorus]